MKEIQNFFKTKQEPLWKFLVQLYSKYFLGVKNIHLFSSYNLDFLVSF